MAIAPIEGLPWGTTLPFEEFPKDLRCPWCPESPRIYRSSKGLRGHAAGKHGIFWTPTPWDELSESYKVMLTERRLYMAGDYTKLQAWHMLGISMVELLGYTWEEAAKELGRYAQSKKLAKAAASDAGLAYIAELHAKVANPAEVARMMLTEQSAAAGVSFLMALEWAKEAHDYDAVHRMTKDLLKVSAVMEPEEDRGNRTIQVFIGGDTKSFEGVTVEADWKELPPGDK